MAITMAIVGMFKNAPIDCFVAFFIRLRLIFNFQIKLLSKGF